MVKLYVAKASYFSTLYRTNVVGRYCKGSPQHVHLRIWGLNGHFHHFSNMYFTSIKKQTKKQNMCFMYSWYKLVSKGNHFWSFYLFSHCRIQKSISWKQHFQFFFLHCIWLGDNREDGKQMKENRAKNSIFHCLTKEGKCWEWKIREKFSLPCP